MRLDVLTLLLACVHPVPPPLYPAPLEPLDLPEPRRVVDAPGDCHGTAIRPGWVADCIGIAESLPGVEHIELVEADLRLVVVELAEERAMRELERTHAERLHAEAWQRARVAERDARLLRTVVPFAFGGGLVLGGAAAIGVLAASEEVRR